MLRLLLPAAALLLPYAALALDNGVVQLPVLGWNSWCSFGPCGTDICNEQQVLDTIAAMQRNGLVAAGYDYVTLDDCFAMRRNRTTGELFPDPARFPRGFAPLVAAAHAADLKFGIYTSAGDYTCHAKVSNCSGECNVGSLGHYETDARTFARWELDFIKMDWCSASVAKLSCEAQYGEMARALNATGRPVALYMSCGGNGAKADWPRTVSNIWRIGFDHLDCWEDGPCSEKRQYRSKGHGTLEAISYLSGLGAKQGPGGYGTPDFLKTGGESCTASAEPGVLCPTQSLEEYRTEMTMWAIASAPLLISTDVRNLTAIQREILLNPEVLAVDQQPVGGDCAGAPGRSCGGGRSTAAGGRRSSHGRSVGSVGGGGGGSHQVWTKPLRETAFQRTKGWSDLPGHSAVVLLNTGSSSATISANLTAILGLQSETDSSEASDGGGGGGEGRSAAAAATKIESRDVWAGDSTTVTCVDPGNCLLTATVPSHGTRLYRVWRLP